MCGGDRLLSFEAVIDTIVDCVVAVDDEDDDDVATK